MFLQFSNIENRVSIIGGAGQAFNSIGKEIHSGARWNNATSKFSRYRFK